MDDQDFTAKLTRLMAELNDAPEADQEKLKLLAEESRARQDKLKKTVTTLQESLDYLRLSVKYLVFDLEATRRENQYLRKLLEDRGTGETK